MDLNLLIALDALLATGSVTAAAQRLHRSTPAMSHTLARIRTMVGDPILVRAGRKLVPTPRALELMEPVNRLLAQADALLAHGAAHGFAGVKRTFVIRAPDGIPVVFGAALALALEEAMPAARLQFLPEGHSDVSALREGRIDLDIGSFRGRHPEIEIDTLSEQMLVGAVRAGHPLVRGKLTAQRYAAQRHVMVTLRQGETSTVDAALESADLTRFVALQVPSAYGALVVAARSHLVATVAERTARAMQAGLGLAVFELPLAVAAEPVVMAWHPRHGADPAHAWLRACVKRVLGDPRWKAPPVDALNTRLRRKPAVKARARRG